MMISFLYVILAILGLSFLVFIHELGHYIMARRVGMRVETFSIGFGTPIIAWERDGVQWQICWLLFGGYVRIAGADLDKDKDPYTVPGGFFTKTPWDRIKVALMGPITNLVFALLAFTALWIMGGREKNFADFTSKIGWVDPASELYADGVRPGDEITAYGDHGFQGSKDHLYAPMTADQDIHVKGQKVDYLLGQKQPFDYNVKVYQHPSALEEGIRTAGVLHPANYISYDRLPGGRENPLPEGSPLQDSGIQYGDRLVWVDGEFVYSLQELNHLLSGNTVYLTVERGNQVLQLRIPRVKVQELRPDAEFREELVDWQFEAGLQNIKIQNLYTIPYNITNNGVVENQLRFVDKEKSEEAFPAHPFSSREQTLHPGDRIVAIYGMRIQHAYELLQQLQTYRVNIIVQRNLENSLESYEAADKVFDQQVNWQQLNQLAESMGTAHPLNQVGDLYLLHPVTPKTRYEFALSPEKQNLINTELQEQKHAIEGIQDPERKGHALKLFQQQEKRLLLGLPGIQDRKVQYNPNPFALFGNVFEEITKTLTALVSGSLNPKWIVGPIGIVQVVHDTSMTSLREAFYWLGAISLNLGVLNLLPIPVLDGGTILMCLVEIVTRKRIHPKTLEKLVLPFAVLLITFFIFLTYHDVMRLFSNFI